MFWLILQHKRLKQLKENPARERIDASTNATFKITDTKLHVPIVTLSTKNDKKILEQLKSVFKRTVK